jgi:hypothetical protein
MMPIRPDPDLQHLVNEKKIPGLMAYISTQPDPELFGTDTEPRIPKTMTSDPAPDPTLDIF